MTWRPDIEGLRAVAILLVVGYHAGLPGFAGGYIGVDVFFVVSGYLITGLLVDERERHGRISFTRFYARRARRLLPAAALMIAVTLLVGVLLWSPGELAELARTARAVAVYAGNLVFVGRATDYFTADPSTDPFLHTWSLAVEEQFYLVWPAVVAVLAAIGSRWWGRRRVVVSGLAIGGLVSFGLCLWLVPERQSYAFFTMPPRVWEFAVGAVAGFVSVRRGPVVPVLGAAGVVGVVASGVLLDDLTTFPGWATVPAVVGTALILVVGGGASPLAPVLGARPMQWLGARSYSWYLWHWPALAFALVVWPEPSLAQDLVVVVGALGIAALSYRYVEQPVRHRSILVERPWAGIGLGVALACTGVAAAGVVALHGDQASGRSDLVALEAAAADVPEVVTDDCILGFDVDEPQPRCTYGDPGGQETAVLYGDSHAGAWFPAVDALARQRGWRLVVMTKASCPTADVEVFLVKLRRPFPECREFRSRVFDEIERLQPVITVLADFSNYVPRSGDGTNELDVTLDEWRDGLQATTDRLDAVGAPFVRLADPPTPLTDVPRCLARRLAAPIPGFDCALDRSAGLNQVVREVDAEVLADSRHGVLVDLVDVFCPDEDCPVEAAGVVRFYDQHHLSATFSASLGPELAERIDAALSAA